MGLLPSASTPTLQTNFGILPNNAKISSRLLMAFQKAAMGDRSELSPRWTFHRPHDPNPLATLIGLIAEPAVRRTGSGWSRSKTWSEGTKSRWIRNNVGSDPSAPPTIEHFGFRDGLSQPVFLRKRTPLSATGCHSAICYVVIATPVATIRRITGGDFLRNGSFMVVRKMEQDVEAFEDLLERDPPSARNWRLGWWGANGMERL